MSLNLHMEILTTSTIVPFIQSKQWSESYAPKTRITRPQQNKGKEQTLNINIKSQQATHQQKLPAQNPHFSIRSSNLKPCLSAGFRDIILYIKSIYLFMYLLFLHIYMHAGTIDS